MILINRKRLTAFTSLKRDDKPLILVRNIRYRRKVSRSEYEKHIENRIEWIKGYNLNKQLILTFNIYDEQNKLIHVCKHFN